MPTHSRYMTGMDSLLRHIRACNDAELPGGRLILRLAGQQIGYVDATLAERMVTIGASRQDDGLGVQPEQLQPIARALADAGVFRWRSEAFDVRATPDGPVLGQLDRGALPTFGVMAVGVHLNGLVSISGETHLWVARRAADKQLDPGKFDHLVAGGVASGHGIAETLVKEAQEEAGLPSSLVEHATHVATIDYAMRRQEGLRRDRLHCYDLDLPADFKPVPQDGEVEEFALWDLTRVLETVRRTDHFKFNVNLVLIDLFLRRSMVPADEAALLRAALSTRAACDQVESPGRI